MMNYRLLFHHLHLQVFEKRAIFANRDVDEENLPKNIKERKRKRKLKTNENLSKRKSRKEASKRILLVLEGGGGATRSKARLSST